MLGWISPRRIGEQLQQQNHLLRQGWIRIGHVLRFERTSLTNSPTNHSFRPAQRLFSSNFSRQINLWKKSCHRHPRTVRPHYAKSLVQPRNPPEQTLEIASCCSCRCRGGEEDETDELCGNETPVEILCRHVGLTRQRNKIKQTGSHISQIRRNKNRVPADSKTTESYIAFL